jgi:carbon starvation protein
MRNQGKSISEYAAKYISPRIKFLFFAIVFLELLIVIAVFGLVIAVIFHIFPMAVLPVWLEIPIAMLLGYVVYKKGQSIMLWSIIAIGVMYLTVIWGVYMPIEMPAVAGIPATGVWSILLLAYAFIASVLAVTTLLQPRDFINSHQLVVAMVLLVGGVLVSSLTGRLEIVAPAIQTTPAQAPPMWPFLFVTIACGAISGFHSLVSSGTSSKQVRDETDALFVGYGSMLMEGALSTLVIIAVAAGIGMGYKTGGETLTGISAWTTHYASWSAAAGLGSKINAFVTGSANMIAMLGIPAEWAICIMGVFVASFAGTTLDTATRIQRYVITEIFTDLKIEVFKNRYVATFAAVTTAALLAFATGANGKGALTLWPLFGAVNQTLAALALIVITMYLKPLGGVKWMISGIPSVFMLVMTFWATVMNQMKFIGQHNGLLIVINTIVILIVMAVTVEGLLRFFKVEGQPQAMSQA